MKCTSCQTDVPATSRFCPNCAQPLVKEQDIKSASEVSIEWLKAILEVQGYKIELNKDKPNTCFAFHDTSSNLFVDIAPSVNILSLSSRYTMKKPGWGQKDNFWAALNKANSSHRILTFNVDESMDVINISTFMYLTERISSRDVIAFIDLYNDGIYRVFDASGLKAFA
jgi:hypothetical protein